MKEMKTITGIKYEVYDYWYFGIHDMYANYTTHVVTE